VQFETAVPIIPHRQIGGDISKRGRSQAVFPVNKGIVGLSERTIEEKGGGLSTLGAVVSQEENHRRDLAAMPGQFLFHGEV
jgi:hypothetical protein